MPPISTQAALPEFKGRAREILGLIARANNPKTAEHLVTSPKNCAQPSVEHPHQAPGCGSSRSDHQGPRSGHSANDASPFDTPPTPADGAVMPPAEMMQVALFANPHPQSPVSIQSDPCSPFPDSSFENSTCQPLADYSTLIFLPIDKPRPNHIYWNRELCATKYMSMQSILTEQGPCPI
jgi:hypothetical protein